MRTYFVATALTACTLLGSAMVASCTYDFDAAFSETPSSTGTPTGGLGGGGGTTPTGGSAGSTASGGEGTGGSAGTGGTGGPGGEDCTNGADDDGDQDVDCADTDCQIGWECAVEAPPGWEGPFAVYRGSSGETVPDCTGSWSGSEDFGIGIDIPAASCTGCACSAPTIQCSLPQTTLYDANGCAAVDAHTVLTPTGDGVCIPFSAQYAEAVGTVESVDQGSSCAASGGTLNAGTVTWTQTLRICQGRLELGGCNEGQVCAPRPDTSFGRCIMQAGAQICPAPYTERTEFYQTFTDNRACSTCTCGAPSGLQCDGDTELYQGSSCTSGFIRSYGAENKCDGGDTPDLGNASFVYYADNSAGGCPSQGGQLTGSATESDLATLCCLP